MRPEAWRDYFTVAVSAVIFSYFSYVFALQNPRKVSNKMLAIAVLVVSLVLFFTYGTSTWDDMAGGNITLTHFKPSFEESCKYGVSVLLILSACVFGGIWVARPKRKIG